MYASSILVCPLDFCSLQVYGNNTYACAQDLGMPTAGVCDQRFGVFLRHLPKAGVYDLAHTALSHCRYMQGHLLTSELVSLKCRKMDILAIFEEF